MMRTMIPGILLFLLCCKTEMPPDSQDLAQAPDLQAAPDLATPAPDMAGGGALSAPMKTWTWIDVPGTTCNDGTTTGVGVYLTGSKNVFLYMVGGGACWDYQTCYVQRTASLGPFGKAQFEQLNLQAPPAPFNDYNWIIVPYCTGDLHGGDNAPTYMGDGKSEVFRHQGYRNMAVNFGRVAATVPQIDKMVLIGSSAGGFGTLLNYEQARKALSPGKLYVIDDCGPPFLKQDIPAPLYSTWRASWKLDATVGAQCSECVDDLSKGLTTYAKKYPQDRVAVIGFMQDGVLRRYLGKTGPEMEAAMKRLAPVIDPLQSTRYFFIPGENHVTFGNPGAYTVKGVNLGLWLVQMVTDDSNWKSVMP